MKKILTLALLTVFFLTGCNQEMDVVQKYKDVMSEIIDKEVYHTKESVHWEMLDGVVVEQEAENYYSKGNFYHSVVQNDTSTTNVVCVDKAAYLNRIVGENDLGWLAIENISDIEGYLPWIVKIADGFSRNDEYISYEETDEGIVVTYDRTEEITGESSDYNETIERYYFDHKWNLQKVVILAEATTINENGETQKAEVSHTVEFLGTSKQEIEKKIEDAFSEVK